MAKLDTTTTALVWPGKYNEDGSRREIAHVNLPFQVIETVNESRATREEKKKTPANLDFFDTWQAKEGDTFEDGWKNKLIWGDNLLVMGSLLKKFAGKIGLIYIDPPFATGADFSFKAQVGESGEEVSKAQTIIEEKAYRDTWGRGMDSYIAMMYDRLVLMRELLADNGSIYVHCDWRVNAYLRLVLDEVFGKENFRNELIWQKIRSSKGQANAFGNVHDSIFAYSKTDNFFHAKQYIKHDEKLLEYHYNLTDEKTGRKYQLADFTQAGQGKPRRFGESGLMQPPAGKHWIWSQERIDEGLELGIIVFTKSGKPRVKRFLDESKGQPVEDIWIDLFPINSQAKESVGYPTQKPESLLERIIKASSNEGDLVADFFCGSGTTAAVAERLGRRWITCDLGRWAVHTTRKRMLDIGNCKPFELLNLGKYERQYWQGVTFGDAKDRSINEQTLYQYLAFILKLYGAQPLPGMTHLHGRKGNALVHIGAVDAPVTINQVNLAVDESVRLKQKELHILGWEWEMGLNNLVVGVAKAKGVKLKLFNIPREVMEQQAAEKGDVSFFELAYLKAAIKPFGKSSVWVELQDFVIANAGDIPADTRGEISKWSDYIDYWAVDWDFQGDTFMQGWVAYRTHRDRTLRTSSYEHTYAEAGDYRVLVKVIDIFGNDTSQLLTVPVKEP